MHATKREDSYFSLIQGMPGKEIKDSWTTLNGKHTSGLRIEEVIAFLSPYSVCIPKSNGKVSQKTHYIKEKDFQILIKAQESQTNNDYIDSWFEAIINVQYHTNFQHFLAPYPLVQLVPHIIAWIEVHFSNRDISSLNILLRKCVH